MTDPHNLLRCVTVWATLPATAVTHVLAATGPGEAAHFGLVAGGVSLVVAILFRRRSLSPATRQRGTGQNQQL